MDLNSLLINLGPYNTFGIALNAQVFYIKNTVNLIDYFTQMPNKPYFVLGGGSNIILTPEIVNKNILKIEIKGIEIVHTESNDVFVKIGAGENWDDVVKWSVDQNLSGIASLSAIPGTAGATPVQNVGAYGAEIKDVFVSLTAYDTKENRLVTIKNEDCNFSYRNSIFKSREKGRYIIIDILLKLSTISPTIPDYAPVKKYFIDRNNTNPTLQEIRDAIIEIRWSKLPKPEELGNCGSFFENPIVGKDLYEKIKSSYPDVPGYELPNDVVKIPAGWLIEQSGLKGVNFGSVRTYEKNALVLVNSGGATHEDVMLAKQEIVNKVNEKFGIVLQSEPEFV